MNGRLLLLVVVLVAAETALSDLVVWDYDLTALPDGWSLDGHIAEWTFTPDGAFMWAYCADPYSNAYAIIYTDTVTIPSGCDSVVFHAEQELQKYSSGTGWAEAAIHYRINGQTWLEFYIGPYQTTDPIHDQVPVNEGDILDFRIRGFAQAGSDIHPGSGGLEWLIWDLSLTLYGEAISLDQSTWASIKAFQLKDAGTL